MLHVVKGEIMRTDIGRQAHDAQHQPRFMVRGRGDGYQLLVDGKRLVPPLYPVVVVEETGKGYYRHHLFPFLVNGMGTKMYLW